MSAFSENLRRIRFERHMTQEEFAALLGTTKQNISRYESGAVSPKITTAQIIAEKLGMSLSELNGDTVPEDEIWEIREELRRNPEYRSMLKLTKGATKREMEQIKQMIRVIRGSNDYDETDTP